MTKIHRIEIIGAAVVCAGIFFYLSAGGVCSQGSEWREVKGDSMRGIVEPGQKVRIKKGYYDCHEVKRGDLIAYKFGGGSDILIKRVVGIPGDTWRLEKSSDGSHVLFVNQIEQRTTLDVLYRFTEAQAKMLSLYKSPIPEDTYLILGNQPGGTLDSSRFGLIGKNNLLGKVTY